MANKQTRYGWLNASKPTIAGDIATALGHTPLSKLSFIIIVSGYAVIAFRGNMSEWQDVYRYGALILFALFLTGYVHSWDLENKPRAETTTVSSKEVETTIKYD